MFNEGGGDSSFKKINIVNRRMFVFSAAKAVVFFGIVARLYSLQINENKKYLTLSDKNRLREWKLPPIRGEFEDFFGNTSAGNYDLYVVKYNSSGTKQWTKQLGTSSIDNANGVATDSSGTVYVTGGTYGGLDGNTSAGGSDLFVVKYDSDGVKQ